MMTVFDPPPQTAVWDLLGPFHLPANPSSPSWDDLQRTYDGRIGVIRSADDWARMPRQVRCRCVVLMGNTGCVLRWCRADVDGDRGRLWYHQDLVRAGDQFTRGRSGWMRIDAEGNVSIAA